MNTSPKVIEHILAVYKKWYIYRDGLPKKFKYGIGDRIEVRFERALELLQIATYQSLQEKIPTLERALSSVDMLKFFLRVAYEVRALDEKKYIEMSEGLDEAGRQIGGWKKGLQKKTSTD